MEHISVYTDKKAWQLGQGPKFVRWAVMLGIVVLLNVFFLVARSVIFPTPEYQDFCPTNTPVVYNQTSCTAADGTWVPSGSGPAATNPTAKDPGGYCDYSTKCQKPYQAAQADHSTKSFIFLIGLGILSLIIGILPIGSSIVSSGLSYGGVLAFVIASGMYWTDAPQLIQLGISAIALAALIYIGLKRFRD